MSFSTQMKNAAVDVPIGVGAVSLPVWIEYLKEGAVAVTAVGGAILVGIRIAVAIRDYRKKTPSTE